jgi:hypothetical protein
MPVPPKPSPELPEPENAPASLLKPALGELGVDGELGWITMAPLVDPVAPAPGMDGAPDGTATPPAPLAPRPPPTLELPLEEAPPLLKPPLPDVPEELFDVPPPDAPVEPVAFRPLLPLRCDEPKAELPALPAAPELPLAAAPPVGAPAPLVFRPLSGAVPVALPAEPAGAFDGKPVCAVAERLNTAAPIPRSMSVERVICIMAS